MFANTWIHYGLNVVFVCLQITLIIIIIITQTYLKRHAQHINACHVYSVECVFKNKSIISMISLEMQSMVLCVFNLLISLVVIVRTRILYLYQHHQIGSMKENKTTLTMVDSMESIPVNLKMILKFNQRLQRATLTLSDSVVSYNTNCAMTNALMKRVIYVA